MCVCVWGGGGGSANNRYSVEQSVQNMYEMLVSFEHVNHLVLSPISFVTH